MATLDPLKREDFEGLLDTELPLQVGTTPTTARLVEVRALQKPSPRTNAPFALAFVVPDSVESGQGTHCLTHPTLGAIELFLAPVGREPGGVRYEAIFD